MVLEVHVLPQLHPWQQLELEHWFSCGVEASKLRCIPGGGSVGLGELLAGKGSALNVCMQLVNIWHWVIYKR